MPALTNRATLEQIRMLPLCEITALPAEHLMLLQQDASEAVKAAKRLQDWIEAAITLRFEQRAIAARGAAGKDTGSVRFQDGDVEIVADLPKKVEWDQARLAALVEQIRASGENPSEYVTIEFKVPERAYLRGRELSFDGVTDLFAHHDLTHWETKSGYPGMIGVVRDLAGVSCAIHRTYLQVDETTPNTVTKAAVSKPRMMLGKVAGGAVRLAPINAGAALGLCEGIETGLAVMMSCPGLPVWATLSATNLEQVKLPPEAHRIVILADHDASGAGMRAAEAAARRLRGEGRQVAIALPPTSGDDFNDVLLRDGPKAVAAIVEAAFTPKPQQPEVTPSDTHGRHLPVGFVESAQSLPTLRADDGDLARSVNRAWGVLLQSNRSPWIFRAGGLPTWIVPDDEGRPVAAMITDERLRHMLAKLALWRRAGRNENLVPAHPPIPLIKSLLATPDPSLPVLAGIVMTPVFGRGGTLLTEPGYHPDARLFYCPTPGFTVPPIPEQPTADEIVASRSLLIDDLLGDFPFTSLAERAHGLSN